MEVAIIDAYHFYQLHTKYYPKFFCQGQTPYREEITENDQCRAPRDRLTADIVFSFRHIIEQKLGHGGTVHYQ
jgi:hypothetical protein